MTTHKPFAVEMDKTYDDMFVSLGQAICMCTVLVVLSDFYQIIFIMVTILIFFKMYEIVKQPHKMKQNEAESRYLRRTKSSRAEVFRKTDVYQQSMETMREVQPKYWTKTNSLAKLRLIPRGRKENSTETIKILEKAVLDAQQKVTGRVVDAQQKVTDAVSDAQQRVTGAVSDVQQKVTGAVVDAQQRVTSAVTSLHPDLSSTNKYMKSFFRGNKKKFNTGSAFAQLWKNQAKNHNTIYEGVEESEENQIEDDDDDVFVDVSFAESDFINSSESVIHLKDLVFKKGLDYADGRTHTKDC